MGEELPNVWGKWFLHFVSYFCQMGVLKRKKKWWVKDLTLWPHDHDGSFFPVTSEFMWVYSTHTHTKVPTQNDKMTWNFRIFFLGGRCISSRLAFISLGSTKKKVRSSWGVSTEQVQQGNSISKSKKIGKTFGEYFLLRRMGGKEHITIFFQMGVTTRRIIPVSKWLITTVSKSPKKG